MDSPLLSLTQPDDWHLHLRDGQLMKAVLADSVARFARVLLMPNLKPPIINVAQALAYRERVLSSLPALSEHMEVSNFQPLMTLYLTEQTPISEVERVAENEFVLGFKLYPTGATTNSDAGLSNINKAYSLFEHMQKHGVPLLIHGEVTDADVDIFEREQRFIEQILQPLLLEFPKLRVVLEHITTEDAVEFIQSTPPHVAATITAHHLLMNRNALFTQGIRPHHYCLPILKHERHRQALLRAATSANPKFFLGTDSAPHPKHAKESACGCAGCYTAHAAIELYAEAFDSVNALDKLEGFSSHFGADFYHQPRNTRRIQLCKKAWEAPSEIRIGANIIEATTLVPLRAGQSIAWRLVK